MAKLHFKYGAMNSGKSDTLIKTAYNYIERGLSIVTIKPSIDTKGDTRIIARGGAERDVDIIATPDMNLREAIQAFRKSHKIETLSCVLIDEAQFLTADQVDQLLSVAKSDNISVITYGLRADFKTKLFPGSKRLLETADNIEKLPTMCRCGNQAEFNCRKVNGKYVFEGEQVAIDGEQSVTYDSLCGTCYLTEKEAVHA
ncbi:MAG: thymidine kinase [Candidatus Saccharibacteria bacterium]|nr:thymidine kinase [Candidatus Saccharibacteria bacterium]